jgi:hypothetical protein
MEESACGLLLQIRFFFLVTLLWNRIRSTFDHYQTHKQTHENGSRNPTGTLYWSHIPTFCLYVTVYITYGLCQSPGCLVAIGHVPPESFSAAANGPKSTTGAVG